MNQIKPELKSIKNYLNIKKFIIPEYQREYSWSIKECEQLWEDIKNHIDIPDVPYFFGTIILTSENKKEEFSVIDGQ